MDIDLDKLNVDILLDTAYIVYILCVMHLSYNEDACTWISDLHTVI